MSKSPLSLLEICAGAGGQALGLERAGFVPVGLVERNADACATLRANRPEWNVLEMDFLEFVARDHPYSYDVDLLAAGLPRVKSASTVKRAEDRYERELLKAAVWLASEVRPRALVVENVPGLAYASEFEELRAFVHEHLQHLGYRFSWFVLNAADFGVPQTRKQAVLVALQEEQFEAFRPPERTVRHHVSVGTALQQSMAARGWRDADAWAAQATSVAPTLVGGSANRGGADLGPSGTRRAWARMGVNSASLADEVPGPDFRWQPECGPAGMVKLTVTQAAVLQGFPDDWQITGRKTSRYRQVGHASPPPVGEAVGAAVARALRA
ncbi:DNA cytosine methyltransferase [Streptomyces longispororuber]|uniref:DNA cytosine methyltransferase n=1 Tax=Streptomyces longispororuber TaxID=68230 RepID=UPI0036FE8D5C